MFSSNIPDEHINSVTIAVNANIQRMLADGTMSQDDADFLHRMLIRVQLYFQYLNFITSFDKSFWTTNASSTANASSTTCADNIAIKQKLDVDVMTVSEVISPKLVINDSH